MHGRWPSDVLDVAVIDSVILGIVFVICSMCCDSESAFISNAAAGTRCIVAVSTNINVYRYRITAVAVSTLRVMRSGW